MFCLDDYTRQDNHCLLFARSHKNAKTTTLSTGCGSTKPLGLYGQPRRSRSRLSMLIAIRFSSLSNWRDSSRDLFPMFKRNIQKGNQLNLSQTFGRKSYSLLSAVVRSHATALEHARCHAVQFSSQSLTNTYNESIHRLLSYHAN